jgi:nucleoside-diphosphate-sugar epimerase
MSLYKNKKVVVTGGSGFVGTNMVLELKNRGANVRTSTHKRKKKMKYGEYKTKRHLTRNKYI